MASRPVDETPRIEISQAQLVRQLFAQGEQLRREGHSLEEIQTGFVKAGIHEKDAEQMVGELSEFLDDKQGEKSRRNILYGILWLLGAGAAGAAIYTARLSLGAWLAAIIGGILGLTQLCRGIKQSLGRRAEAEGNGINSQSG
jgi:hypothetical protein